MKNNTFIYILIITIIIIFISIGVVLAFSKNVNENKDDLKIKAEEEIEFLEDKIIAMMNKLNNINFLNSVLIQEKTAQNSENQENEGESKTSSETSKSTSSESSSKNEEKSSNSQNSNDSSQNENIKYEVKNGGILVNGISNIIDWEYMKSNAEMIYSIWPTIIADLNALEIDNEEILNFSNTLDATILSIKNEDKLTSINNLAALYSFLPTYKSKILDNKQNINIDYCKNCILNSYLFVEQNNWNEVKNQLNNAMNYYTIIMDSISENIQSQSRVSKAYILLNELNNSINLQDKELYYIKYRNLMEELINL